eukprot:1138027-Pelagomonas_calceolata.AAC.5
MFTTLYESQCSFQRHSFRSSLHNSSASENTQSTGMKRKRCNKLCNRSHYGNAHAGKISLSHLQACDTGIEGPTDGLAQMQGMRHFHDQGPSGKLQMQGMRHFHDQGPSGKPQVCNMMQGTSMQGMQHRWAGHRLAGTDTRHASLP